MDDDRHWSLLATAAATKAAAAAAADQQDEDDASRDGHVPNLDTIISTSEAVVLTLLEDILLQRKACGP